MNHGSRSIGTRSRQRGGAVLVITAMLALALLLTLLYLNRSLVSEQRMAANQQRSTLAFEAAEAGLEWALAQLNGTQRVGDDCRPDAAPSAQGFRERHLAFDAASGRFTPRSWNDAGTLRALQPACVRAGDGWSCSCPGAAAATPAGVVGERFQGAFTVRFETLPRPGSLRIVATGCAAPGGPCAGAAGVAGEATARTEVVVALLPAVAMPPLAALTASGRVRSAGAALGVHAGQSGGGGALAVHSGQGFAPDSARVSAPTGGSLAQAIAASDAELGTLAGDRLFTRLFGLDKAAWQRQAAVTSLACRAGDCASALAVAAATQRMLWIDGDAQLAGPLTLGTAEQPVVLVVDGALELRDGATIHGMVYARSIASPAAGVAAGTVRGGAVAETDALIDATTDFHHDSVVLSRLARGTGSFVRVPGGWRDF
jgi:hypothetical protein